MSIREELRTCAATQRVNIFSLSFYALEILVMFKDLNYNLNFLSSKDRATFLLLVAEAL